MSKVLVVASKFEPEYSGPGIRVIKLYDYLKNNEELELPDVICGSNDFNEDATYKTNGFKVQRITSKNGSTYLIDFFKKIFVFLKTIIYLNNHDKEVDVLHVLGSNPVTHAAVIWGTIKKKKIILELVNRSSRIPFIYNNTILNLKKRTVIIAISRELEDKCNKFGYSKNVWYRPNPVDLDIYKVNHATKHSKDEKIYILNVASFIKRKNQELLIDALYYLPKKYNLTLAGPLTNLKESEPQVELLRHKINEYGLHDRVNLVVEFVNTYEYLSHSDIYALPAYNEGLGTPLLEAIACAKPIVANENEPVYSEWVYNGVNGYLTKPTPKDFAKSIEKANKINISSIKRKSELLKNIFDSNIIHNKYFELINVLKNDKVIEEYLNKDS